MSKASRRARRKPARSAAPTRAKRPLLIGVAALVVAAVVAAALLLARRDEDAGRIALPPPTAPGAAEVSFDSFVGADACAECHRERFDEWSASTHGRAGGDPGAALLRRPFDGRAIRLSDGTVRPIVTAEGDHAFRVERTGRETLTFTVDGVVGGAHMVGGGTQGFVTRNEDGTLRFLPWEWSRDEAAWFCNTSTRAGRGWVPITPDMALADCGDWPPVRVLGDEPRFANCQSCHGSQIEVAGEPGRPYATRLASLAIDCESCHGPAATHVALAREGRLAESTEIGMRSLATLDERASLDVCFRCHALKDRLASGYLAGEPFDEHYSVELPLLGDAPLYADGRIRTFAYQQGHLYSDCYLSGRMTCVDCHDPHSQGYRDVNGTPLKDRFADGQCTACHPSKADRIELHTRHPAASAGSRCVSCHMPYLQEPEVGDSLRYARSDHAIPVPRPAEDARLGVEVACQLCHTEANVDQLQRQVDAWYGDLKPRHPLVAAQLAGEAPLSERTLAALDSAAGHTMAKFRWLGNLIEDVLRQDAGDVDAALERRLRGMALNVDDGIAAGALAALHYARGNDAATRSFLAERLRTLGPRETAVRRRWAVLLGYAGDRHRTAGRFADALAAYRKALEIRPDDAALLRNQGLAYAAAGDLASAQASYAASLRAEGDNSLVWVNLGIARAAAGDATGAEQAYREALRVNPYDELAHFNLGNVMLRGGRAQEAIEAYRLAVARAPGFAPAHFNLARAAIVVGDLAAARDALRDGLEFERDDAGARQLLAQIDSALAANPSR